jgi:hypothetical protein
MMDVRRYILVFIGVSLGLWLLQLIVMLVFGFDISNGGMVVVPPLVAGAIEGNRYARRNGALPTSSEMWKFSRLAALFVLGITMVFTVIMAFTVPELRAMMSQGMGAGLLMGMVLIQATIAFLATRFFLGIGAKTGLKAQ